MNTRNLSLGVAVGVATLLSVGTARAETISLAARLGYGIPTGESQTGKAVEGGVVPLQIDAMYALGFGLRVGLYGSYGVLTGLPAGNENGRQTRLGAQAHFSLPVPVIKPWVGAGIGYEWVSNDVTLSGTKTKSSISGLELFNLQAGLQFSVLPLLTLGPYVQYQRGTFSTVTALGAEKDIPDANRSAHGWLQGGLRAELSF